MSVGTQEDGQSDAAGLKVVTGSRADPPVHSPLLLEQPSVSGRKVARSLPERPPLTVAPTATFRHQSPDHQVLAIIAVGC